MKSCDRGARANVIIDIIQKHDIKIIAEIGVDKCAVLRKVLGDCGNSIQQYWAIDPWVLWDFTDKYQKRTESDWNNIYLRACGLMRYFPQLHTLKVTSLKASKFFPKKYFDLVFIDADHQYEAVQDDIEAWLPLIKKGGFITGHDYGHKNFPGVKKAVDEFFDIDFTIRGDKVWIKEII